MKIFYDKEADSLYIQLSDSEPEYTAEVADGCNVDLTEDDKPVGIEILNASTVMDVKDLKKVKVEVDE